MKVLLRLVVVAILGLSLSGCAPIFATLLAFVLPHALLGTGVVVPNLSVLALEGGLRAEEVRRIVQDAQYAYKAEQVLYQVAKQIHAARVQQQRRK